MVVSTLTALTAVVDNAYESILDRPALLLQLHQHARLGNLPTMIPKLLTTPADNHCNPGGSWHMRAVDKTRLPTGQHKWLTAMWIRSKA